MYLLDVVSLLSLLYLSFSFISFVSLLLFTSIFLFHLFSFLAPHFFAWRRNEPSCRGGDYPGLQKPEPFLFLLKFVFSLQTVCFQSCCPQLLSFISLSFSGINLSRCRELSVLSLPSSAFIFYLIILLCFVFAVVSFYLTAAGAVRNMLSSPS